MKKVLLCVKKSMTKSYVGGVITIINAYLDSGFLFNEFNYEIELFNYQHKSIIKSKKINNIIYGIRQKRALSKRLKNSKIDIVNIHTSMEFLFLKDILLARVASKKAKVVLTIHVGDINTVFNRIHFLKHFCINSMNKKIDKVVFLSHNIKNQFIEIGLQSDKSSVLYNFHCFKKSFIKSRIIKNNKLKLLFVGAIHKEKGIVELLKAFELVKTLDIELNICGQVTDVSVKDFFECSLNKNSNIHSLGYVTGEEKYNIFNESDILILPSYHEGMPLVVLEALASGTAIISTKVGATPEILDDSNVYWVDKYDFLQIAAGVKKMYDDRDYLNMLKNNNYHKSSEFSLKKNVANLCCIFDSVGGK